VADTALGLGALAYYAYNHASFERAAALRDAGSAEGPVAAAGAPAPDPDDPQASRRQDDAGGQTQRKPSYESRLDMGAWSVGGVNEVSRGGAINKKRLAPARHGL